MTTTTNQVRFNKDEFKMMQYLIGEKAHYFSQQSPDIDSSDECDELVVETQKYINILTKFDKKFGDSTYQSTIDDLIKTRTYIIRKKCEMVIYEKEQKIKEEAKAKLIEKQKSFKADKELLIKRSEERFSRNAETVQ